MQVLFILRFYHPEKTDKIDRLIHASSSKMAVIIKMSSVVKQLLHALKLFRVTAGCIHSFRILSKETFRIMYPKYSVFGYDPKNPSPLWIIWINNPFFDFSKDISVFGLKIRIWILVKKRSLNFNWSDKNEDKELTQLLWNKFKVSDISSLNFIRLLRVLFSSQ